MRKPHRTHQRRLNVKQRQLVDRAVAGLIDGINPTEGKDPETTPRRPGCEHANACISVATAGNWEALSCGNCSLWGVPEDHSERLLQLASQGGANWDDLDEGIKNRDVGPLKKALAARPEAAAPEWMQYRTQPSAPTPTTPAAPTETPMPRKKSEFEELTGKAAAVVAEAIASTDNNYSGWYMRLVEAAEKKIGTPAAFRMYVLSRRRKKTGKVARKPKGKTIMRKAKPKPKPKAKPDRSQDKRHGKSPAELAAVTAEIVSSVSDLTPDERSRVFEAVDNLIPV